MSWQQEYTQIRNDLYQKIEEARAKGIPPHELAQRTYQDRPIVMEDILKFAEAARAVPEIWEEILYVLEHNDSSPERMGVDANFADFYRIKYQETLPTAIERICPGVLLFMLAEMKKDNPRDPEYIEVLRQRYFQEDGTPILSLQMKPYPYN